MLRIEFPSASPGDVTGPQAPMLLPSAVPDTHTCCLFISWDTVANYAPIITLFDCSLFSNEGRSEFIYLRVYSS